MPLAYLRHIEQAGTPMELVEIITLSPGSPPERPHPEPPDPNAPRPSHPIALPGDPWWPTTPPDPNAPRPEHPIMLPGMPGWPDTPPQPGEPPKVVRATVASLPAGATPPAAAPADATVVLIDFGAGTKPTYAWVAPYVSTGPVS